MAEKKTTTKKTAAKTETKAKAAKADDRDAQIEALKAALEEEKAKNAALAETAERREQESMEAMREQLAAMQKQLDEAKTPQIITISQDEEKVQFLWQAEVADDNVTNFGENGGFGRIIGKTGVFFVPKSALSRVLTTMVRDFLDERKLMVVSGLTDEEREALGVAYREGEILDRRAFARMVELEDKILDIYPALCDGHKEMVAKRYNEAYQRRDPHVKRDVVEALYRLAKEAGRPGDFKGIVEAMNAAVTEGE